MTFPEFDKFFFHNLKWIRFSKCINLPKDYDFNKNIEIRDFKFLPICFWKITLFNMNRTKKGVVIVGDFINQSDMDWAEKIALELGLVKGKSEGEGD